jgi:DNA-binding NtrC family response regulator
MVRPTTTNNGGGAKRVGLVDDEPMWRRLIGRVFESKGHKVVELGRARDVISKLRTLDALCLDIATSDANGLDLVEQVHKARPELPILVVTADARVDSAVRAMRLGVVDYVTKPAEQKRLSEAADRVLEAHTCLPALLGLKTLPTLDELERRAIECALALTNGQVSQAAAMLGIGRATLYRKIADRTPATAAPTNNKPKA